MEEFTKNNNRIMVIDSPCGFGKTSYAIQAINESSEDEKIIYITPFLAEVKRIIDNCPCKHFIQPNSGEFKGSKSKHLLSLVQNGRNIVSTHALFMNISEELIDALRINDYTLYLDEVFETVGSYNISEDDSNDPSNWEKNEIINESDMISLLSKNFMTMHEDYSISWTDQENTLSKYENLKNLSERKSLYFIDEKILIWSFPVEVFREGVFSKIYILTYLFDSQIQSIYYKYFDIPYIKYSVFKNENDKYEIEAHNDIKEKEWKSKIKEKIHIIEDPKLNKIGDIYYDVQNHPYKSALSVHWFNNNRSSDIMKKLGNNIGNYYKHHTINKTNLKMWTCFKSDIKILKDKNLTEKQWAAINARATNSYKDRTLLCYPVNRFTNPSINKFFSKRNLELNQDQYALSEIIQWIWRSAIREMQDITIYIPSQRMRTLLKQFLNDEPINF
jgi:hypothetical protein